MDLTILPAHGTEGVAKPLLTQRGFYFWEVRYHVD